VLAVIQAVITSRTLYLGGTTGPVKFMNDAQLMRLTTATPTACYGWPEPPSLSACGDLHRLHPEQVAHAQEVKEAIDAGEL